MDKILVVVVTYNAMQWIDRCLSSVDKSENKADLYIVDNGSTDGTQDYIIKNYPKASFTQNLDNLGFGKANNLGLEYALKEEYDYVYLLNQDAWIFPETIGELIRISKANPEYGILSPFQMNANGRMDNNFLERISRDLSFNWFINDLYNGELKEVYDVSSIMAAHWLLPRHTILKVGGFSPSFPHYGEDDNYSNRALYKRLKIGIVPKLKVVHDRSWREETKQQKIYNGYTTSIFLISNPVAPSMSSLVMAFRIALSNMLRLKSFKPISYLLKYCGNLKWYFHNRIISETKDCAFLNYDEHN